MLNYLYNLATDKYRGIVPSILKLILFILSLIYGLVVRILIFFQSLWPFRLGCKVISVGNITLGGTGKTVLVEYIARYLKCQGKKVAIVSRGYKRVSKCQGVKVSECLSSKASEDRQSVFEMGDEPYMLSKKLGDIPVIVDADRIRGAKVAIKDFSADTIILDDAFQQWKIKKDLEIITVDASNPFGNKQLLPRGILREPLSSLKRADIFILTKVNLNPDISTVKNLLAKINPQAPIIESSHRVCGIHDILNLQENVNVDDLKSKIVGIFCGIGDPESFANSITSLGIKIGLSFSFRDHHNYTQKDLDGIVKSCKEKNIDTVVTTEKDASRILGSGLQFTGCGLLVLEIEIKLKDEQEFHNRLLKLYTL